MIPIPINDHIRRRIFWSATLTLIVANVLAFMFELSLGPQIDRFVFHFSIIPARYTTPRGLASASLWVFLIQVLASMFLHGGWLHLIGNMLFLFVFGRSIEDRFGHAKFLLIYFLSGLAAALTHIFFNAGSTAPTIGASGAIAGILGAYFVCFPAARITTLIPFLFFFWRVEIPAVFILGYWFLIQFFTGFEMMRIQSATQGGIAWWAHVGGFVAGMALALLLKPRRPRVEILPPGSGSY
jgi:membrane associated rhomboid family serine protease